MAKFILKILYAPVRNSEGKVVAIVAVDIDASYILEQKNQVVRNIAINMIFSLIVAFILAIFISKKIEIKTGDELESLGNAVTQFISNIRDIVEQISNNAENVSNSGDALNNFTSQTQKAIEEVTSTIQGIAAGASEQAANINDISYLIQKISTDINGNEENINFCLQSQIYQNKLIY